MDLLQFILDYQLGETYYPICTFPASSECLIGISDAFCAFCLRVSVIFPTCSLYPQQKRAYSAYHPRAWTYIYRSMREGSYRVQSPGFPKIVYLHNLKRAGNRDSRRMKTAARNRNRCRSIVLGKEMFLGYTSVTPERVSVGDEGEYHSMSFIFFLETFLSEQ